jgi:IS605 OrfB family transposase
VPFRLLPQPCPAGRAERAAIWASRRDGHLREAISELIACAMANGCSAIVIEDLDFAESREEGRERSGNRPSRGRRGKAFRRLVSRLPTAKFRDRLAQMATNQGLSVIAVDAAYTSKGEPSAGSPFCNRSRPMQAATMRRRSSSADAGSDTEHGDGKGVTYREQSIANGELPTPPSLVSRSP